MIDKLRDTTKKTIHINRKEYNFHVSYNRDLTFYTDQEDNILDVYKGKFAYLDEHILTISDGLQHCKYYDINTGKELFSELTSEYLSSRRRCHTPFMDGIALIYNDIKVAYEVVNNKGEVIGVCDWLYRINKNTLFARFKREGMYSLLDGSFNVIKKDVSTDCTNVMYNEKYIIATRKETKTKEKYFLVDIKGNKISDEYSFLKTKDFINFNYIQGKEKGVITIDKLISS